MVNLLFSYTQDEIVNQDTGIIFPVSLNIKEDLNYIPWKTSVSDLLIHGQVIREGNSKEFENEILHRIDELIVNLS